MKYDDIVDETIKKNTTYSNKDIYITEEEKAVLEKYAFDYRKYDSLSELSFDIEEYLNDIYEEDLEYVLINMTDRNYYNNTNK
ncbi:MAG: hypothetical protein PHD02_03325 [Bacilli bacterium]|nr:hypothetical protein [Bacilli bacterium]